MADYPLKGFKVGADTYTVSAPSKWIEMYVEINMPSGTTAKQYINGGLPGSISPSNISTIQYFDLMTGTVLSPTPTASDTLADILGKATYLSIRVLGKSPVNDVIFYGSTMVLNNSSYADVQNDLTYGLDKIQLNFAGTGNNVIRTLYVKYSTNAFKPVGYQDIVQKTVGILYKEASDTSEFAWSNDLQGTDSFVQYLNRGGALPQAFLEYRDSNNVTTRYYTPCRGMKITLDGSSSTFSWKNAMDNLVTNHTFTCVLYYDFPDVNKHYTITFTVKDTNNSKNLTTTALVLAAV